ncbi:MAG: hypothetical protein KAR40_13835 [Candidatus Sabulitectum sp.]|nr:hypothetical protein [Candidatus Sabulitectum sp.]
MLQKDYAKKLQIGQVGSNARPSAPWDIDRGVAGVELKPGDGVFYDAATNRYIKPTTADTRKLVTHIVTFNSNSFNTDIAVPSTNNTSEVVFAIGAVMPLAVLGSFFVLAGETVEAGDAAIFNESTGKWIKYSPIGSAADLRKKAFEFYLDPGATKGDGEIVEVRIPTLNYAFPALASVDVTAKVSMTALEIKALRATPIELVAAPGADTILQFVSALFILTAGTEVLTETADNMAIEYDDGNAAAVTGAIESTGFIDAAADAITNAIPAGDVIDASADIVNKNLVLLNTGDGEFAGNASDDAALDVYVTYRIVSLA